MTTISLTTALELLAQAHDVVIVEQPSTTSFTFDPDIEDFMGVTAEDDDDSFEYVFNKADNAVVQIHGETMTLHDVDLSAVVMRLMVPLRLETGKGIQLL